MVASSGAEGRKGSPQSRGLTFLLSNSTCGLGEGCGEGGALGAPSRLPSPRPRKAPEHRQRCGVGTLSPRLSGRSWWGGLRAQP